MTDMIEQRTWDEFREAGLLWWVNRILHIFGWVICCREDDEGHAVEVYPAHCHFRGFSQDVETRGYLRLTKHIVADLNRISVELPGLESEMEAQREEASGD